MTNRTPIRRFEGVLLEPPVVGAAWIFVGGAALAAVIGLALVIRRTGTGDNAGVSGE